MPDLPLSSDDESSSPSSPTDFSSDVRQALAERRQVGYVDHGERKIVQVDHGGHHYAFYYDIVEGWCMDVTDDQGAVVDQHLVLEDADAQEYLHQLSQQDLTDNLRQALREHRQVDYEEFGAKKVVTVEHEGRTYRLYRDYGEYADWMMEVHEGGGALPRFVHIREAADAEYLEALFQQDLTDNLRQALREHRQVDYEEFGAKKVVTVEHEGRTYVFHQSYGDWVMQVYEGEGETPRWVEIVESTDVEYLEALFSQDLTEGLRQALAEHRQVSRSDGETVMSVEHEGITYRFHQSFEEWVMEVGAGEGREPRWVQIREADDANYLDELRDRPSEDEEIQSIRDRL